MSGFTVNPGGRHAWRQKGYHDGFAGRPKKGPVGLDAMSDYLIGYKRGVEAAERSRGDRQ